MYLIVNFQNCKLLNYSIPLKNHNQVTLIFDITSKQFILDLYKNNLRQCQQRLKYLNFKDSKLSYILHETFINHSVEYIFFRQRYLILIRKDLFFDIFLIFELIFERYLVSNIFCLNINTIIYYCYALSKTKIVFKLKDKMSDDNNIFQELVSTKDLKNYYFQQHKLQVKEPFLNCVLQKINIERLIEPLIFFVQSFSNLLYYYQKSFIRAVKVKQQIV